MEFKDYAKTISGILNITPTFDSERESAAENIWNAALLNLPKCESCKYWKPDIDTWGDCKSGDAAFYLGSQEDIHREFGCIFHSKIEQLRKNNENK